MMVARPTRESDSLGDCRLYQAVRMRRRLSPPEDQRSPGAPWAWWDGRKKPWSTSGSARNPARPARCPTADSVSPPSAIGEMAVGRHREVTLGRTSGYFECSGV